MHPQMSWKLDYVFCKLINRTVLCSILLKHLGVKNVWHSNEIRQPDLKQAQIIEWIFLDFVKVLQSLEKFLGKLYYKIWNKPNKVRQVLLESMQS